MLFRALLVCRIPFIFAVKRSSEHKPTAYIIALDKLSFVLGLQLSDAVAVEAQTMLAS